MLANLDHPHLVDVLDFFEERGNAYLVMRFVAGESLGARGALGAVLASLALSSGAAPGGDPLPNGGTVLVTDFEPGASYVGVSVHSPGTLCWEPQ